MGWQSDLSIRRVRLVGEIDYATDEFMSPFGRLKQGTDGAWYPVGLRTVARLEMDAVSGWSAELGNGARYVFRTEDAIAGSGGVYAWLLSEVTGVLGDRTTLEYETNASGRKFLKAARYGGRAGDAQYEIELVYEDLPASFEDYRAGIPLILDRRVSAVVVKTRSASSHAYTLLHRYDLGYERSPLGGPAFYLRWLTKIEVSGESEPATEYTYDYGIETLEQARLRVVPGLEPYLASAGDAAIEPGRATLYDLEDDGLIDLEHHRRQGQARLTTAGWVFEALPPAPGRTHASCREDAGAATAPRVLARMRAESREPEVFAAQLENGTRETRLTLCDRLGQPIEQVLVAGSWALNARTRLVDLNRDQRPDVIRVYENGFDVLENTSTAEDFRFIVHQNPFALDLPFTPETVWVHDFNGDGIPDIIARHSAGVVVLFGRGGLTFDRHGRNMRFQSLAGTPITQLAGRELIFLDANRDGLTDVLLRQNRVLNLFINQGPFFREVEVPMLRNMPWSFGVPVVADFAGSGDAEVAFAHDGQLYSLALNHAGTGLLRTADDGKGTFVELGYERARATPGLPARPVVLSDLHIASSGYDDLHYSYAYDRAVAHPRAQIFVGFGNVDRAGPLATEQVTFHNDDELAGVLLGMSTRATTSPLVALTSAKYEERLYQGIRFWRPKAATTGWMNADGSTTVATETENIAYERELCPSIVETRTPHGILVHESLPTHVPRLPDTLQCLPGVERWTGRHADPSLDFSYATEILRNDFGQPETIQALVESGPVVLQSLGYDAQGRLSTLTLPGKGTNELRYDPSTGILSSIIAPDGVVTRVTELDPVTDAIRKLELDRGPGGVLQSFFRYDGLGRLERSWTDAGAAREDRPSKQLRYRYASLERPASIEVRTLLHAEGGYSDGVTWMTAAGESMAQAVRIPEGWSLSGLVTRHRSSGQTFTHLRPVLPAETDLGRLDHAALLSGTSSLASSRVDGFGDTIETRALLQQGVTRTTAGDKRLEEGLVVARSTENGAYGTRSGYDADGHVTWTEDESGQKTEFRHDALGRLVQVTQSDGKRQTIRFDELARASRIERDGLTTIEYRYVPAQSLLESRTISDASGRADRVATYAYDAAGRMTSQTQVLSRDRATRSILYDYDGELVPEPPIPGQRGLLSRVRTEGYEKRLVYNRDGTIREVSYALADWRRLSIVRSYRENGALHAETYVLRDGANQPITTTTLTYVYDPFGRLERMDVDGGELAHVGYDHEGRPDRVELSGGGQIAFHYDPVTHRATGYWADSGAWQVGLDWRFNDRGLIAAEAMTFGGEPWTRSYGYDARGFLTDARDPEATAEYEYTVSGLPRSVTDARGARTVERTGARLRVGRETYVFDPLGRVVRRGDLSLQYGASGQVEVARRGSDTWSYLYDEAGARVLKLHNGEPVEGRLDGVYLDADRLILPVRVASHLMGVLVNGQFQQLATDPRGSLLTETGAPDLPTPYGLRQHHSSLAAAIDYVEKGYDADLGVVRMGVRDYDPYLNQFWSPDPLYLESLDACAESPLDCNLFSYARNDPTRFVDPAGENPVLVALFMIGMGAGFENSQNADISAALPGAAGVALSTIRTGAHLRTMTSRYVENEREMRGVLDAFDSGGLDFVEASETVRRLQDERSSLITVGALEIGATAVQAVLHARASRGASGCRGSSCVTGLDCFVAGTRVETSSGPEPIEEVGVGERVLPMEPGSCARDPVTAESCREVQAEYRGPRGEVVSVTLLRSGEWVQETGAREGGAIDLAIDELGVAGGARVISVGPCRSVVEGPGCQVTMTTSHLSRSVVRLTFTGTDAVLEPTARHPFWSADRGTWVRAGELVPGERLLSATGPVEIASLEEVAGTHRVYNLEVAGAHTYQVSSLELFAHNNCTDPPGPPAPQLGSKLQYFLGRATGNAHNIERSRQMLSQLEWVGLFDTPKTRQYLAEHLASVFRDSSSVSRVQTNGRVVRESLLVGPRGILKFETVWEGERLITGNFFGGPL